MADTMYKKIVDENGNERFVEVVVEQTAPAQETKPAETKNPNAKTFGEVMHEFWVWLKPRLSGGVVGAGALFAAMMFLGRGGSDTPQIPGGGVGGGGLGNGPDSLT